MLLIEFERGTEKRLFASGTIRVVDPLQVFNRCSAGIPIKIGLPVCLEAFGVALETAIGECNHSVRRAESWLNHEGPSIFNQDSTRIRPYLLNDCTRLSPSRAQSLST